MSVAVPALRLMRWTEQGRMALETLVRAGSARIDLPEMPSELERARALIDRRRLRAEIFGDGATLFYDPVWDMLLELFVAHEEGAGLTVSALCNGSSMPATVRRRWIMAMEQRELVTCWPVDEHRSSDPDDRHVGLTGPAVNMLLRYLDAV